MILCFFGDKLKKQRELCGFSQEKLAEICGFDRTYISMLETGKRNPSLLNIVKISHGLNISLGDLLEGIGK